MSGQSARPSDFGRPTWADAHLNQADFNRLATFIHEHCGIRCPPSKRTMLEGRLRKRLRALDLGSFHEYCKRVLGPTADPAEVVQMVDIVTTNKTDFFREAQHFEYLVDEALPTLERSARTLTFWSAGCSTGEEVYTLAMVLESNPEARCHRPYSILGSDISTAVLRHAHKGIYSDAAIAPVPLALRRRFLLQSKDRGSGLVRITPELRKHVRFTRINLLGEPHERGPFDVIFCRNVFIYFDRPTQRDIVLRFCARLRPGGFLFLGHSDSIAGMAVPLAAAAPTIYTKRP